MLPDFSCTAPPSQSQLHCFRKNYSFLVSLKIPKYKIPHNSTNRWRQKKEKQDWLLSRQIAWDVLGFVNSFLWKSVLWAYINRGNGLLKTHSKKQKFLYLTLSVFLLHSLGISVSSRFCLVSAHNQSLPLDPGGWSPEPDCIKDNYIQWGEITS